MLVDAIKPLLGPSFNLIKRLLSKKVVGYDGNISLYTNMSSEFCLIMSNVVRLMSLYTEKINEGVNSSRVDSLTFINIFISF